MMQNKMKIAVTGGIGSGKSTVAKIIRELGYPVVSCDEVYADLLKDKIFLAMIAENFGNEMISNGTLDRQRLAEKVFADMASLEKLNALTHPIILREVLARMSDSEVAFCEVPLLFENSFEKFFDKVIVVLRDRSTRIDAVALRDKITKREVVSRMNRQIDYDTFDFAKYYVIHNDKNFDHLRQKTVEILTDLSLG